MMTYLIPVLRTLSEVLTAAVAMTAFSVLLFSLQFLKKRQKLAFALVPVLLSVAVIYSADALETIASGRDAKQMWQLIHWTGFVVLVPGCFEFAMVLLEMTGKERNRFQRILSPVNILISLVFVVLLWSGKLFKGIRVISNIGTTMVHSDLTVLFWIFFAVIAHTQDTNFSAGVMPLIEKSVLLSYMYHHNLILLFIDNDHNDSDIVLRKSEFLTLRAIWNDPLVFQLLRNEPGPAFSAIITAHGSSPVRPRSRAYFRSVLIRVFPARLSCQVSS